MNTAFITLAAGRAPQFPACLVDARFAALGDIPWIKGTVKTNYIRNP